MKQIPLTRGQFALVDDEDFEFLNQWKWYCCNHGYAVRTERVNGKKTVYSMHRVITKAEKDVHVDHIDNDKLNNQKVNLRFCNFSQNNWNVKKRANNTSGFKGVYFNKRLNNICFASIGFKGKLIYLGTFKCPIEAAKAYNEAALKYFGEFANLNEIP